jgi:hypothetical protein
MCGQGIWQLQSRFLLQQKQKKLLVSASIGFIEYRLVEVSQTFHQPAKPLLPKPDRSEHPDPSIGIKRMAGLQQLWKTGFHFQNIMIKLKAASSHMYDSKL